MADAEDEHGMDEGIDMDDTEARIDELMAAVQMLSARLAVVEGAQAPETALAQPETRQPGGVPLGKITVIEAVSSSSFFLRDVFVHLGSSSSSLSGEPFMELGDVVKDVEVVEGGGSSSSSGGSSGSGAALVKYLGRAFVLASSSSSGSSSSSSGTVIVRIVDEEV